VLHHRPAVPTLSDRVALLDRVIADAARGQKRTEGYPFNKLEESEQERSPSSHWHRTVMAGSGHYEGPAPIAVVEYELTDDVAIQSALDLLEHRAPNIEAPVRAFRGVSPVVVLVAAAAQIVVAMAAVIVLGGRGVVATVLVAAGALVTSVLLWKAAFYGLPSMARWVVRRGAIRQARGLTDRRIRWLLFEDRSRPNRHRRIDGCPGGTWRR
jgi:hypothetical protein